MKQDAEQQNIWEMEIMHVKFTVKRSVITQSIHTVFNIKNNTHTSESECTVSLFERLS